MTLEETRAKNKAYYEANKEKFARYAADNYAKNAQKRKDYSKAYRDANKEKVASYNNAYRLQNKEQIKSQVASYRATRKEKISTYNIAYNAANRESKVAYNSSYHEKRKQDLNFVLKKRNYSIDYQKTPQGKSVKSASEGKRRAIKHASPINDIKEIKAWIKEWKSLQKVSCYWCKKEVNPSSAHGDHVMPLSKGGAHCLSNLVIACTSCNLRKQAKHPDKWIKEIGFIGTPESETEE